MMKNAYLLDQAGLILRQESFFLLQYFWKFPAPALYFDIDKTRFFNKLMEKPYKIN